MGILLCFCQIRVVLRVCAMFFWAGVCAMDFYGKLAYGLPRGKPDLMLPGHCPLPCASWNQKINKNNIRRELHALSQFEMQIIHKMHATCHEGP